MASEFLMRIVRKANMPFFHDEYQLQVTMKDKEQLGLMSHVLDGNVKVASLVGGLFGFLVRLWY